MEYMEKQLSKTLNLTERQIFGLVRGTGITKINSNQEKLLFCSLNETIYKTLLYL